MTYANNGLTYQSYVFEYISKIKKKRWEEIEMYIANSQWIGRYMNFLENKKDKEEFYNKILAVSLSDIPNPNNYTPLSMRKNYAKEYIETSKEKVAV
jgi:hypothetical protein